MALKPKSMSQFSTHRLYEVYGLTSEICLRSLSFFRSALALRSSASFAFLASISALRFSDIIVCCVIVVGLTRASNNVEERDSSRTNGRLTADFFDQLQYLSASLHLAAEFSFDKANSIMSLITPTNRPKGSQKSNARRNENNRIYANPLPLIIFEPEPTGINYIKSLLGLSITGILNPHCEGYFDPTTRSVWVTNETDSTILWRRGFFGKGDLSRSEPSWLARQINARKSRAAGRMCLHLPLNFYFVSLSIPFRRDDIRGDYRKAQSRA